MPAFPSPQAPRLTIFAGPNGSGKSTVKKNIPVAELGLYLNPDELEKELRTRKRFAFKTWRLTTQRPVDRRGSQAYKGSSLLYINLKNCRRFVEQHALAGNVPGLAMLAYRPDGIYVRFPVRGRKAEAIPVSVNSYLASILIDYLRQRCLMAKRTFTFETVMSHASKLTVMEQARAAGFTIHFKFITTSSPIINVERVRVRVARGGHPVNEQKIVERYHRTHQLLAQALELAHYAQVFDNSAKIPIMLLEKTPGQGCICHRPVTGFPTWFVRDVMMPLQLVS